MVQSKNRARAAIPLDDIQRVEVKQYDHQASGMKQVLGSLALSVLLGLLIIAAV